MKDGVPKQTGNSRYLKSAIAEDITFEQFRDLLRNGTLPVDLNKINSAGWAELGTPLNKASLMSGTVESQYGLSATNTPSDVFVKIKSLINTVNSNISSLTSSKIEIVVGTYTGDGKPSANAERQINLGFKPKAVLVSQGEGTGSTGNAAGLFHGGSDTYSALITGKVTGSTLYGASLESYGFRVWQGGTMQLNHESTKYYYIAFK